MASLARISMHKQDIISRGRYAIPFAIGISCVLAAGILFLATGDGFVVAPFDQLDSVVEKYQLALQHAHDGFAPELMGGTPVSELGANMPLLLALFGVFSESTAYALLVIAGMIVGYAGLYALLRELGVRPALCAVSAIGFAFLPFFATYGLSSMGVPLVAFAFVRVWKSVSAGNVALLVVVLAFFSMCSSFVLVGYSICMIVGVVGLVTVILRAKSAKTGWVLIGAALLLMVFYLVLSGGLLDILSSASSSDNTRAEWVLSVSPVTLGAVLKFFCKGHYHAVSNHLPLVLLSIVALLAYCVIRSVCAKTAGGSAMECVNSSRTMTIGVVVLMASALAIAVFYVLYHGEFVVGLRNGLPGAIKTFQLDRFYWLYPTIWWTACGEAGESLLRSAAALGLSARLAHHSMAFGCIAWGMIVLAVGASFYLSARANIVSETVDACYVRSEKDSSELLTWRRYFAEDLFEGIAADIGRPKADYRVVSIGMHPSVALHNGFYTLDGYRAYYPLEYKHKFRRIIAGELEEDPNLREYFDGWGSRCYVFSHEVGQQYLVAKTSEMAIRDLRIDVGQLRSMGGEYVFSAVDIEDPKKYGLKKIGEYSTSDSYWKVRVYQVE